MKEILPLRITNLRKEYAGIAALSAVSFSIRPGEVFGLLGPNGAGKTTLISIITTLQKATSGLIEVFGMNPVKQPRKTKALIGYVPQELVHNGFFTVRQILSYHAQFFGIQKTQEELDALLAKLDLYDHRYKLVGYLSGGMKRRLMIAKALVHEPKLLLLDEPTAGVDLELRNSLWNFIHELKEKGISILLTTHYLEEAEQLCDRIAILQKGKIRQIDDVATLLDAHSFKRISLHLKGPIPSFSHSLLESIENKTLHFKVPPKMVMQELLAQTGISYDAILDVTIKPGSLEDVMENVLKEKKT